MPGVSRRRTNGRPFALMAALLALLLLGGGVLGYVLQRDDTPDTTTAAVTSSPTSTGTTTATPPTLRTPVLVYFVREGKMGAAGRTVPKTPAIGTAALNELVAGPTADEQAAGLSSALPANTTVDALDVASGLATVKLSKA